MFRLSVLENSQGGKSATVASASGSCKFSDLRQPRWARRLHRDIPMPHLGHGDLLAFSRFLLDIHSATGLEGFSRRVASELRRLIPAHRCSYNYLSADGRVA